MICAQAIRRAWLPTLFLLGLVGVPGCGGAAPPPSDIDAGAGPPRDGRIAFSAPAPGGEHIFTIDARGGSRLQLTTEGSTSKYPAWSMDGATTVFSSDRTGTFELWTMHADGTAQTRIPTELPGGKAVPQLSPDGTTIVARRGGAGVRARLAWRVAPPIPARHVAAPARARSLRVDLAEVRAGCCTPDSVQSDPSTGFRHCAAKKSSSG